MSSSLKKRKTVSSNAVKLVYDFSKSDIYKYIILKLSDELTDIMVDKIGGKYESFQTFLDDIPDNQCKFIYFKSELKVLLVFWFPEDRLSTVEKHHARTGILDLKKKCKVFDRYVEITDYNMLQEEVFQNLLFSKCY